MTPQEFDKFLDEANIFVSKPLCRLLYKNWGFFILPAYHYRLIPKFYFFNSKYYTKLGVSFAGYTLEIQHDR